MNPYQLAKKKFEEYCAVPAGTFTGNKSSDLQIALTRWKWTQLPTGAMGEKGTNTVGAAEEGGELADAIDLLVIGNRAIGAIGRLCHLTLKNDQKIRGMQDEETYREAAADAIGDISVFLTQLCTVLRLDYTTLYQETANQVLQRRWKDFPNNGIG